MRIHYFKRIKSLLSNGYRLFRILLEVSISAFSLDPKSRHRADHNSGNGNGRRDPRPVDRSGEQVVVTDPNTLSRIPAVTIAYFCAQSFLEPVAA